MMFQMTFQMMLVIIIMITTMRMIGNDGGQIMNAKISLPMQGGVLYFIFRK